MFLMRRKLIVTIQPTKLLNMKKTIIHRNDNEAYLIRWSLLSTPWFAVKLHKIIKSDDECHHDHPWNFITIILKGGYVEYTKNVVGVHPFGGLEYEEKSKIIHPFSIHYRDSNWTHRLEIHQICWSLVITFEKKRPWGFLTKSNRWVHWRNYKSINNCE